MVSESNNGIKQWHHHTPNHGRKKYVCVIYNMILEIIYVNKERHSEEESVMACTIKENQEKIQ